MSLKDQIEWTLAPLISLPLVTISRLHNMFCFHFGSPRIIQQDGRSVETHEFVLQISCTWRVSQADEIIAASRDLFIPADWDEYKPVPDPGAFDWTEPGSNRADIALTHLAWNQCPLVVEDVQADVLGGVMLELEGGFYLEIFPDDSFGLSYWRLLNADA